MKKLYTSGHTVVIFDEDTPETIALKIASAQYIIDMRTDITEPLEYVARRGDPNSDSPKTGLKKPKYRFNI